MQGHHGNPAEIHPRRRAGEAGECQPRRDRHEQQRDHGLDRHDDVGIRTDRGEDAVADRRHGLYAEEERVGEGADPGMIDRAGPHPVQPRERHVQQKVEQNARRQERRPSHDKRAVIDIGVPERAVTDPDGTLLRTPGHHAALPPDAGGHVRQDVRVLPSGPPNQWANQSAIGRTASMVLAPQATSDRAFRTARI